MNQAVLQRMGCTECRGVLRWRSFRGAGGQTIEDGVVWCPACRHWYPIEGGLLEFLPPSLAYAEDRERFWKSHGQELAALGFHSRSQTEFGNERTDVAAQRKQQEHFDWYANNDRQTYTAYEQMPFWRSVDRMTFRRWRRQVQPNRWLLDVGCAQGRSASKLMDLPIKIVGIDISKALVRQAIAQYQQQSRAADATFFVADASRLPFQNETFDYVLIYGVLHHLPDPASACREVARVLRPGGIYFGSENNQTIFRALFDLLQRLNPIWHEEAGPQPLIGKRQLQRFFSQTQVRLDYSTHVFVPPHLVNWLGHRLGKKVLQFSDRVARNIPLLRNNGGLIMVRGKRAA